MKFFQGKSKPDAKKNERAHYRSAPAEKYAVVARIYFSSGDPLEVQVIDLTTGGVAIKFPLEQDPDLPDETLVMVVFSSHLSSKDIRAEARIANRRPQGTQQHYGLSFTKLDQLFTELDAFWFRLFNRRQLPRALPPLGGRVPILMQDGRLELRAALRDLSTQGLSGLAEDEAAELLENTKGAVEIELQLDKKHAPIPLLATLARKVKTSKGLLFGAMLSWPGQEDFGETTATTEGKKILADYVKTRLEEVARWNQAHE